MYIHANYGKQVWVVSNIFVFGFGIKNILHMVLSEVVGVLSTAREVNEAVLT